jgi:hypothetical protein
MFAGTAHHPSRVTRQNGGRRDAYPEAGETQEPEGWQLVNPSWHSVLLRLRSNDCRQSGILSALAGRSGTMLASRANESRKRLMTSDGTPIAVSYV